MCGIAGIARIDVRSACDERILTSMGEAMIHRGPDGNGNFLSEGVGLTSRRLAILDLSANGQMPMTSTDGRYTIVHNGEVYNFRELRKELESKGDYFRSETDTEVVLNLYRRSGPSMLQDLNGMFAFAIWDRQEKSLFIARDRLGVKPLYYAVDRNQMLFASEEKCFFAAGWPALIDEGALEELICFRYRAGEETPFKGIYRLLPGHFLKWSNGTLKKSRWWNLAERAKNLREEVRFENPSRWFREHFLDSVELRRISDVPVGVLLSGGLDSSSVAAALEKTGHQNLQSFTVSFKEDGYDETPLALETAKKFGFKSHQLSISIEELPDLVSEASWYSDEPLIHGNDTHLLAISRFAKPLVSVLLSGEGGDETLGGYIRYLPLKYPFLMKTLFSLKASTLLRNSGVARLKKFARFLERGSIEDFVLYNGANLFSSDLKEFGFETKNSFSFRRQILKEAADLYPHEPLRQVMYSDQHTFLESVLHRNDRMTMGASIECRVPFLDFRLVEGLVAMPTHLLLSGSSTKPLLRKTWGRELPSRVRRHKKWGFGVPWIRYLKSLPAFQEFISALPEVELFHSQISSKRLHSLIEEWKRGRKDLDPLVAQLYFIGIWYQTYRAKLRSIKKAA